MSSPALGAKAPGKRLRPAKVRVDGREPRQLVRWDKIDDLDIQLLLTVQQSCNATGVKIPWALCAETMGTKFTEGAIIQHLSKLRTRREAENKPVPLHFADPFQLQQSTSKKDNEQAPSSKSSEDNLTDEENLEWTSEEENQNSKRRRKSKKDFDPAWNLSGTRKNSSRLKGQDRRASATSQKRKGYDVSNIHDDDEGSDEDALMCVGAPFLDFDDNADKDPDYDSGEGNISVSNFKDESEKHEGSKIVCLPVDASALYNLSVSGHVGGPPMEMTPDQSSPGTGSQHIHSSPSNLGGQGPPLMSSGHYRSHTVYPGNGANPFHVYSNPALSQLTYPTGRHGTVIPVGFAPGNPIGPPFNAITRGVRPISPYEETVAQQFLGPRAGFVQQPSCIVPPEPHGNVNSAILGGNTGNGGDTWGQFVNWDENHDSPSYMPDSMFTEFNGPATSEDGIMGSVEKTDAIDPALHDDKEFTFYDSKNIY
ncbi:hypothetical protein N7528_009844 [Penicillium herquei]|nr:hypothetical protein N7528_009844 [Penicillium herquei]